MKSFECPMLQMLYQINFRIPLKIPFIVVLNECSMPNCLRSNIEGMSYVAFGICFNIFIESPFHSCFSTSLFPIYSFKKKAHGRLIVVVVSVFVLFNRCCFSVFAICSIFVSSLHLELIYSPF